MSAATPFRQVPGTLSGQGTDRVIPEIRVAPGPRAAPARRAPGEVPGNNECEGNTMVGTAAAVLMVVGLTMMLAVGILAAVIKSPQR